MSTFTSEPGIRLGGRYRLEDRIAAAGGWSAWKAIDEILARAVSVITFAAGFPRLEQVVTAARAASRLTDTRLMQVFDVEDTWDRGYVVLEWPVGETLADLLSAGPMEPIAGARIVAEAAGALSAAHAAGLAHLCLRPDAVRWTTGGGVKVTGLGIDAALEGITADDPALTDTQGLAQLLYAALTGLWPGPEYSDLPPAPTWEGQPRRPRQVRAGVPTALDDVVSRALALGSHDGQPYSSPGELAEALRAVLPPVQVPAAVSSRRSPRDQVSRELPPTADSGEYRGYGYRRDQAQPGLRRRRAARIAAITLAVVIAIAGASAAALDLMNGHKGAGHPGGARSGTTSPAAKVGPLVPAQASGFDALNPRDTGDENSDQAAFVLDGNPQGWSTQFYDSAYFGDLKKGTGLILTMSGPVTVSSITVKFGPVPGADVQIKVGTSNARSAANLDSMTTIASATDVSGTYTFTANKTATGQYIVIWFTKLPPMAKTAGKYMAQIFSVSVKGRD